jgi:hypothetical protein
MQESVRFASRVQTALGAAATFVLSLSLRSTARACGAEEAAGIAVRVMILSVIAAGCAYAISVLMEKPKASEEVLFVGVAAIGLAIWLIVSWLGLLREVAHALDVSGSPKRAAS